MSQNARSVAEASEVVAKGFAHTTKHAVEGPVTLKTRFNPCHCDEALSFEAQIYEQWHHVYLTGDKSKITTLTHQAQSLGDGEIFEHPFLLGSSLYTSPTGQKYYMLVVP